MPADKEPVDTGAQTAAASNPDQSQALQVEIGQIDKRIESAERVMDTISQVATEGLKAFTQYAKTKQDTENRSLELQDRQHKRGVMAVVIVAFAVIGFCLTALLKGEVELIKTVLQYAFAAAGGAGLVSLLGTGIKSRPKDE